MRSSSRRQGARSRSRRVWRAPICASSSGTAASDSARTWPLTCSNGSARVTAAARANTADSDSDSRSCGISSNCTAARSAHGAKGLTPAPPSTCASRRERQRRRLRNQNRRLRRLPRSMACRCSWWTTIRTRSKWRDRRSSSRARPWRLPRPRTRRGCGSRTRRPMSSSAT